MQIHAYTVQKAKAPLQQQPYQGKLKDDDVLIKITHCGICHSDVHLADGDWGDAFPLIPGHEVIGEVVEGKGFTPGQRVGLGWQCDSCHDCDYCKDGKQVFCEKNQATCWGHEGGFATHVIAHKDFVLPIPEELDSAATAPLLCGGITVYSPLRNTKGKQVAVIGIGGLGHLALQFAKALNNEVTAISTSKDKEAEAKAFGATHFVTDPTSLKPRSFDLILNTAHAAMDMGLFTNLLKPEGRFVQLGAAPEPLTVPAMNLIGANRSVAGSAIGHPSVIAEMLALAAKHDIKAQVEVVPMSECNEAMDKTRKNKARYRMVLEN